jgi:glyoxylase-like metal-dependent hydrolase (beta-lactamase superfamily II)
MSEPPEVAAGAEQVAPGVWHWLVHNSNIGGAPSSSHLIEHGADRVLIDPVGLSQQGWHELPQPTAIVLTAKCHQRAAWRYRREFGAPVHAPAGAAPGDEQPDETYRDGDALPGGLRPLLTPGPEPVHYCLFDPADGGTLVCSDLLMDDGGLAFVPGRFHDDPDLTRQSVELLLELPFDLLLLDHGAPVRDPRPKIRAVLDS